MREFIFSYRKFFIFITVLLLSITFVSKTDVSAAETKYTVNTKDLNIRTDADADSEILAKLNKGVVVTVIDTKGKWSEIILPQDDSVESLDTASNTGYVMSKYLTKGTKLKVEKPAKKKVSSKGKSVVAYAKKFVGNPYRWGGESLTRGADCSGFVKAVYRHFGKKLPHSSYSLRRVGKKVSGLKNAKAGDIICYSGHVAIYMGNNKIVHASTYRTGIKISNNARYRKIVAIRRIYN